MLILIFCHYDFIIEYSEFYNNPDLKNLAVLLLNYTAPMEFKSKYTFEELGLLCLLWSCIWYEQPFKQSNKINKEIFQDPFTDFDMNVVNKMEEMNKNFMNKMNISIEEFMNIIVNKEILIEEI